jgi:hypothetical protein
MVNSGLSKAYPVRLTHDQEKALLVLSGKGFNKSKFIRAAIEEKLHKDYRAILKDLEPKEKLPFE